jgi:hypothetical protein
MKFKEGDILEFDGHGIFAAEEGATAICRGYKVEDGVEYVQVEWIINELSHGQMDGGYSESHFTKVEDFPTKPGFVEKRLALQEEHEKHNYDRIFEENKEKFMEFKEGDIVELVKDTGMAAQIGAEAKVKKLCGGGLLRVKWMDEKNCGQEDGEYMANRFKKVEIKIKEKVMKFNFEEGKQRIIKLLENHIEDFTHDMMQDIRGVVNGDREEILDPIEDIIHFTRKRNKLIESSISKLYVASSVFEVLEAVEDTIFEEMEMEILTELFGLKEVIKRK